MAYRDEALVTDGARIATTRVHTGKVISLDVDRVRFPDGTTGELEIIRHPGASAIVPFLCDPAGPDPQLLLLKQYRYATGGTLYEIPAGRLDPGESPEQCARRELLEETGCTAESIVPLTSMFTTPGFTDERIHLFLATGLIRGEARREADEFIEVETVTLSNALQMVERGEIQDAKTALGILFVAGFRAGR
ncbi:MAG: NUDIX hydrolase [Gemmatimonadaceae bacterium]